jgi:TolB-like protein
MATEHMQRGAVAPDSGAVRRELERVLESPAFASAPRLARLLRHLVEHTLAGDQRELKEYALGLAVFDRAESFDPRIDTIVRVHARRLRARLREHYAGPGRNSALRIGLPKGHYVASFDWAPQSAISSHAGRAVAPVTPPAPRTSAALEGGLPVGGVILAVLPFDNLSPDENLQYFSDGLSEEILQSVSRGSPARVIGRSSSFQFRGEAKAVRRVAQELGCTHVLDGAVRRSGDRVRVSAQLIECAGQSTVWADGFERDLEDAFALQDEIAARVAGALAVAFSGPRVAQPVDPLAFDLYLRAKASSTQWLGACDAVPLEQSLEREPGFAPAWSALAVTRAIEAHVERDPARSEPLRREAVAAADRALQLDPAAASAYAAQSIVEPICGRFEARDALIAKALEVAPNDTVSLFWACRWSWAVGRHREGLAYITRACQVDPLWAQGLHQYATMLLMVGLPGEAFRVWDDLVERWPERDYLHVVPLQVATQLGDWKRVDAALARLAASGLDTQRTRLSRKRVERIRRWDARETAALARELADEVDRTGTIRLYLQWACRLGLTDHVYALVERASFAHLFEPTGRLHPLDYGLHALFWRGESAMQQDPRYVRLCARLGLCDYWVRTERWPDCADAVAPYYDFRSEARRCARADCASSRGEPRLS